MNLHGGVAMAQMGFFDLSDNYADTGGGRQEGPAGLDRRRCAVGGVPPDAGAGLAQAPSFG